MNRGLGIVAAGALAAMGCKPEVTANDVNSRSSAIVENTVVSSTTAIATLSSQSTMMAFSGALTKLDAVMASMPPLVPASISPTGTSTTTTTTLAAKPMRSLTAALTGSCSPDVPADQCATPSPEEVAAQIDDFLSQNVFTEDNLEASDDTSATFLLKGEPFCQATACTVVCSDVSCTENCVTSTDPACVELFAKLEVRVKATLVGDDGVTLQLLIGPSRANPVTLDATSTSLALSFDLAQTKAAYQEIATVTGATIDLPEVMAGVVRGELKVNGDQDVSLIGSVVQAVEVVVAGLEGETGVSIAAADPLVSVRVQGLAGALSIALSAGAVDLYEPWSVATNNPYGTGTFEAHLAGSSFAATLAPGATDLTVTGIGLGDGASTIGKDGVPFFAVDLNATEGRAFDVTVSPEPLLDSSTISVSPAFDLSLGFAYGPVAADFPDVAPWAYDETLRFALTGAPGETPAILPVPADGLGFPGGIEVLSGTLTLAAASGARLDVPAGSCLVANTSVAIDAHPVIGAFAVTACP